MPAEQKKYTIDLARTVGHKEDGPRDEDAPDAVWMTVTGPTPDDVRSAEIQTDVERFVSTRYGTPASGTDVISGPRPDDGSGPPVRLAGGRADQAVTSADEYLRSAAVAATAAAAGVAQRFVCFYRVRRLGLAGLV